MRGSVLCTQPSPYGKRVPQGMRRLPERRLGSCGNDEPARAGTDAVLGSPRVGDDTVGDRLVRTFDHQGRSLRGQGSRSLLDTAEKPFHPVRKRLIVARGEKLPQLRHILAAFHGRHGSSEIQTPDSVGLGLGIGLQQHTFFRQQRRRRLYAKIGKQVSAVRTGGAAGS